MGSLQPDILHAVQAIEIGGKAGMQADCDSLNLLVDQSPDLLWAKDLEGRFIYANQAACRRLLLTRKNEVPIGRTAEYYAERERRLHPELHDWYTFGRLSADSDRVVLESKTPLCFDEFGNVGGQFLYLKVNKSPLFGDNGDLLGTVASARDVTKERRIQDLKHRLLNGSALFHQADAGIGLIRGGVLVYADQQLSKITGYPVEDLLGSSPDLLFPGDSSEMSRQEGLKGLRHGEGDPLLTRWQHSGGAIVEVLLKVIPLNPDDPFYGDVWLSAVDVSGRMSLSNDTTANSFELPAFLDVDIPLCLLSANCIVQRVNQAFCVLFGISEKEAIGQTARELWNCYDCGSEHCPLVSFKAGSRRVVRDIDTMIRGRHIQGSQYVTPCLSSDGKIAGLMVSFLSKSRQKDLQVDFSSARHHLINAASLGAIGSLASTLAHEFNNPLCGVRSVLERVNRKADLSEPDRLLMELALKECDRMKILIRDLQAFSQAPSESMAEFDLNKTIDRVLPLLSKLIKQSKITVCKNYQGILPFYGVEEQIKQVLLSLLKNSCEAIPDGGGIITIATSQNDGVVQLIIQDTGQGINEQHLPFMFEPFFTTRSEGRSTGLGLAVSRWIIEGHRGTITLDSQPGKGTTFIINLPVVPTSARGEGR